MCGGGGGGVGGGNEEDRLTWVSTYGIDKSHVPMWRAICHM